MNDKFDTLSEELLKYIGHYGFTDALFIIFDTLKDVGDGNISYSDDNLGFNITKNTIEIVDINAGKTIATLTITI